MARVSLIEVSVCLLSIVLSILSIVLIHWPVAVAVAAGEKAGEECTMLTKISSFLCELLIEEE